MKILLTGASGQVGWELARMLPAIGTLRAVDRDELDLSRPATIRAIMAEAAPDVVVNAAGYTTVDQAESEPQLAQAVNADGPGLLADEARRLGAALVHFSTDYVFDGRSRRPYDPDDRPNPLNTYGRTKLAGEEAIRRSGAAALILRTSWVYSTRRHNFLLSILRQAALKPELRVVDDQTGCPTPARLIAQLTTAVVARGVTAKDGGHGFAGREGIYHLACGGQTTWYGFARAIIELIDPKPRPRLLPIGSEAYSTAATRPRYSVLSSRKLEETFDVTVPDWHAALRRILDEDLPIEAVATS